MTQPLFLSRCPLITASSRKTITNITPLLATFAKPAIASTRNHNASQNRRHHYQPRPQPHFYHLQNHRSYHSTHQPAQKAHEYTTSQTTILSAALKHIPQHGFTRQALTLGARDTGFLDVSVQLFARGEFDLVLFWLASRRGVLRGFDFCGLGREFNHGGEGKEGLGTHEKVKILIMERLRMNFGVREQLQGALALMSLPTNIPLSLSELHALSSDILTLAGDTSVDTSWYTKRMAVSAIYASAEMFMTTLEMETSPSPSSSSSPEVKAKAKTEADLDAAIEAFVDRRMQDSKAVGETVDGVWRCLGGLGGSLVGVGRSLGVRL